jgi:hypothetical protein
MDSAETTTAEPVRAASTEPLDIGSDRNRSTRPLPRSVATPSAVLDRLVSMVWARMPAIR